jgi:hypothetical protein
MTLREKQSIFASLIPGLINHAINLGYEITLGEVYRSPEEAKRLAALGLGIVNSVHILKLAIDLNLFKNGIWLTKTEDHKFLGEWWESLSTKEYTCCWGGRFNDGNHYSIENNGIK